MGNADVLLSRKWAALEQLEDLELSHVMDLRQEVGPRDGALSSLFPHLRKVHFQVGSVRGTCARDAAPHKSCCCIILRRQALGIRGQTIEAIEC